MPTFQRPPPLLWRIPGTFLVFLHLIEADISQDLHLRRMYLMGVALSQACILDAVTSGYIPPISPSSQDILANIK